MSAPEPLTSNALDAVPGIAHGFFTRAGGVSGGIYASLNCGPGSGDDRQDVQENRHRVAETLSAEGLVTAYQVHGATTLTIAAGASGHQSEHKADALATDRPGVALGILTADCTPVLFADREAGIIGAAHAGWQGALGGVMDSCVEAMEKLGAARNRIVAAAGPCIGPRSYEVGPEFAERFTASDAANERYFTGGTGDRLYFDLPAYVADRLGSLGLAAVDAIDGDTCAEADRFFSYRRSVHKDEGDYGRLVSAIVLRGSA